MAKQRRVIREVDRTVRRAFDERTWPALLALVVLTGATAAWIAAGDRFDDPRPLRNAWMHLTVLAVATGAVLWLGLQTRRTLGRRLQLAIVVSVILHVGIAFALQQEYLKISLPLDEPIARGEPDEAPPPPPEYQLRPPDEDAPPEEFEKPLAIPQPETPEAQPTHDPAAQPRMETVQQPASLPDVRPQTKPSPIRLRRQQLSAAHLAEAKSKRSRQTELAHVRPQELIPLLQLPLPERSPAASVEPRDAAIERQEAVARSLARLSAEPPHAEVSRQSVRQPTRVERQQDAALQSSTPTLRQKIAEAARVPRAPADEQLLAMAAQANRPIQPEPRVAEPSRAAPIGPRIARLESAPREETQAIGELELESAPRPAKTDEPSFAPLPKQSSPKQPAEATIAAQRAVVTDAVAQFEPTAEASAAAQREPLDAQGVEPARIASGLPLQSARGPVGVAAAELPIDAPRPVAVGLGRARVRAAPAIPAAPATQAARDREAPLRQGEEASLAASPVAELAEPPYGAGAPGASAEQPTPLQPVGDERAVRISAELPVRVRADAGPGGLGDEFTPEVGLPDRRADTASDVVHRQPDKYLRNKIGGAAPARGAWREVAAPFAKRGQRLHGPPGGEEGRPSRMIEESIELGLDFLAKHQQPNGSWSLNTLAGVQPAAEQEQASIRSDAAATGLALLAFLGAGYDHFDGRHRQRIDSGLNYLIRNQKPDGDLYVAQDPASSRYARLYSHGLASIALCEAYGMTGDPNLREPAQKAIDFIVASQDPRRGGWRYQPGMMSDLSVTGWQLMALKSGELAGLNVPQRTYELAARFLNACQPDAGDGAKYVYNPYAADTASRRHGKRPSTVMTSVGLLMRLYTGWNREHPEMRRGADHLLANLPEYGAKVTPARTGTIGSPLRDTYYWYYATQVMFHMKGKYWEAWNGRLHPLLVETQIRDDAMAGSWDPRLPVPDRWGPHAGRIYVTTMNLLSLEVYYRHLPLYEQAAK